MSSHGGTKASQRNSNVRGLLPLGTMNVCTKCQNNPCVSHRDISVWTEMVNNQPTVWHCPESHAGMLVAAKKRYYKLHSRGFTFRQRHSLNFKDLLSLYLGADSFTALLPISTQRTSGLNFASLQAWLFSVHGITELIPVAHLLPTTARAFWIAWFSFCSIWKDNL